MSTDSYNPFDHNDSSNPFGNPNSYDSYTASDQQSVSFVDPGVNSSSQVYSDVANSSSGSQFKDPVTGMVLTPEILTAREEALARREREIENKESQLRNGTIVARPANFPPVLHFWYYYPNEELPLKACELMERMKLSIYGLHLSFLLNWIGCLFCLAPGCGDALKTSVGTLIILSSLFLFVICPISFEISFFVIYNSIKAGKAIRFFCGLIVYILYFLFLAFAVVGIIGGGSVGFISMFELFGAQKSKWVGIFSLIYCIAGCLEGVFMVYIFIKFIGYYRTEGLTKKAIMEASLLAADYAKEHPDVAVQVASTAVNSKV